MEVKIKEREIFYTCSCGERHTATSSALIKDSLIKVIHSCLGCGEQLYLKINTGHILSAEGEAAIRLLGYDIV